jgi:hypothetical protein
MSGRLVHEGRTVPEIIVLTTTRQAAPVRQVAPQIPQAVAQVLDRALAHQQAARYPTAAEMLHALRAAMTGAPIEDAHTTMRGAGPAPYDGDATVRVDQPPAFTVTAAPLAAPPPPSFGVSNGYPPPPASYFGPDRPSEAPVSRPGTGRGRRQSAFPVAVVVACFLAAAGLTTGAVLLLRSGGGASAAAAGSGTAGAPNEPSTVASAVPTVAPTTEPSTGASAAGVGATPAPSASAAPSASSSAKKKPPSDKPCKRDRFTLKCPCAKCY